MLQEMVRINFDIVLLNTWQTILCFPYNQISYHVLGDVLVILDLRPDESLFEAGVAREVNWKPFFLFY